jgi:hypothetical protein
MIQTFSQYIRPPKELKRTWESHFTTEQLKEKLVETAGYVDSAVRIARMIKTTENMDLFRTLQVEKMKAAGFYDFPDGNPDHNFEDPTRTPGFDLADLDKVREQLEERIKLVKQKHQEKIKQQTEEAEKQKAQERAQKLQPVQTHKDTQKSPSSPNNQPSKAD